jgi:hypothetical protein
MKCCLVGEGLDNSIVGCGWERDKGRGRRKQGQFIKVIGTGS